MNICLLGMLNQVGSKLYDSINLRLIRLLGMLNQVGSKPFFF